MSAFERHFSSAYDAESYLVFHVTSDTSLIAIATISVHELIAALILSILMMFCNPLKEIYSLNAIGNALRIGTRNDNSFAMDISKFQFVSGSLPDFKA